MSILDESQLYKRSPSRRNTNSSMVSFSVANVLSNSPPSPALPPKSDVIHLSQGDVLEGKGIFGSNTPASLPQVRLTVDSNSLPCHRSVSLSAAERILASQQRELSDVKYRQYKALIKNLHRDIEYPAFPSASLPSSMITTPDEKAPLSYHSSEEGTDYNSSASERSTPEMQASNTSSSSERLASPSGTENSLQSCRALSPNDEGSLSSGKDRSGSQCPSLEDQGSSSAPSASLDTKDAPVKEEMSSLDKDRTAGDGSKTSSHQEFQIRDEESHDMYDSSEPQNARKPKDYLKENRPLPVSDSDKDRDSWEGDEEDIIRRLVLSEATESKIGVA